MSYADFIDLRGTLRSFDGMVAYSLVAAGLARDAKAQPRLKMGFLVGADFFRVLGIEPALGRGFRPEEERVPGRDAVIVLAHDVWKTECAADPSVIGRSLRLNGADVSVVGVAPESFTGLDQYVRPAFFVPAVMGPTLLTSSRGLLTNRDDRAFDMKGRLKRGVSIQAADAEASALAQSLEQAHPETNRGFGGAVRTELQTRMDDDGTAGPMQGLLLIIVFLVFLIACANVANLMQHRGPSRAREIPNCSAWWRCACWQRRCWRRWFRRGGQPGSIPSAPCGRSEGLHADRLSLYGVSPHDAASFVGVPLFLLAIAAAASYVPARSATRVDPLVALRYE